MNWCFREIVVKENHLFPRNVIFGKCIIICVYWTESNCWVQCLLRNDACLLRSRPLHAGELTEIIPSHIDNISVNSYGRIKTLLNIIMPCWEWTVAYFLHHRSSKRKKKWKRGVGESHGIIIHNYEIVNREINYQKYFAKITRKIQTFWLFLKNHDFFHLMLSNLSHNFYDFYLKTSAFLYDFLISYFSLIVSWLLLLYHNFDFYVIIMTSALIISTFCFMKMTDGMIRYMIYNENIFKN